MTRLIIITWLLWHYVSWISLFYSLAGTTCIPQALTCGLGCQQCGDTEVYRLQSDQIPCINCNCTQSSTRCSWSTYADPGKILSSGTTESVLMWQETGYGQYLCLKDGSIVIKDIMILPEVHTQNCENCIRTRFCMDGTGTYLNFILLFNDSLLANGGCELQLNDMENQSITAVTAQSCDKLLSSSNYLIQCPICRGYLNVNHAIGIPNSTLDDCYDSGICNLTTASSVTLNSMKTHSTLATQAAYFSSISTSSSLEPTHSSGAGATTIIMVTPTSLDSRDGNDDEIIGVTVILAFVVISGAAAGITACYWKKWNGTKKIVKVTTSNPPSKIVRVVSDTLAPPPTGNDVSAHLATTSKLVITSTEKDKLDSPTTTSNPPTGNDLSDNVAIASKIGNDVSVPLVTTSTEKDKLDSPATTSNPHTGNNASGSLVTNKITLNISSGTDILDTDATNKAMFNPSSGINKTVNKAENTGTNVASSNTTPVSDMDPGVISNPVSMLVKTFDHHGGKLIIEDHDITIDVPQSAVLEGDEVTVQAFASLTGPYVLPDGYELVSVFVCIEADYMFNKLVRITIPHFAVIDNLDQSFDVVVLTANEIDSVGNEDGDFVLQMHESVYDYRCEVNDDYCNYYTNHFCSKCLARRRSLVFRLFNRVTLSTPREAACYNRTRITVFFCVPDDYANTDDLLIELCICYSLKHCLQTVHKSYKQRKMLSSKSSNVRWTIKIDDQKFQNFCLSYSSCPGWKIKPIGSEKINVSDLDFHSYTSLEDLRAEEELCLYPPRFKISVVRLSHGKKLDTEFTIALENDGMPVLNEIQKFPLIVAGLEKTGLSNQRYTADVDSSLTSTATNTAATTVSTISTNDSPSVTDISPSLNYHSATDSNSSSLAVGSASTLCVSTPLATDGALVTTLSDLDQTAFSSILPVSSTEAGSAIVNSMHLGMIVKGDINFYQSKESHQIGKNNEGSFNFLECFSTDISESVDVGTILPNLISHGLLTPNQRDYLTHPLRTPAETKQELCGILLSLNERSVKKFLQCLSETSDYDPHKQLLNKIQTKIGDATEEVD